MATPAVAGAVALMLQEQNSLTPDQVKARLMKTARKMGLTSTSAYVPHLFRNLLLISTTCSRSVRDCLTCRTP